MNGWPRGQQCGVIVVSREVIGGGRVVIGGMTRGGRAVIGGTIFGVVNEKFPNKKC